MVFRTECFQTSCFTVYTLRFHLILLGMRGLWWWNVYCCFVRILFPFSKRTTTGFVSSLFGNGLHMFCFSQVWGNTTLRKLVIYSLTYHGRPSEVSEWQTVVIYDEKTSRLAAIEHTQALW